MKTVKNHWEEVYKTIPTKKLGWYEKSSDPTIDLFDECGLAKNARILNVGVGSSTFVDYLVGKEFKNILATDISTSAINHLKERLGKNADKVEWIVDDLTNSEVLTTIDPVDIWIDRAVLHFFIQEKQQDNYFNLLKRLVKPSGFVIISVFSLSGAKICSGLPVKNYSTEMLQEKLGGRFTLIREFDFIHTTPSGNPRDYIYTLFQKV